MFKLRIILLWVVLFLLASCVFRSNVGDSYLDSNMDFGAVQTVAVMPFTGLTRDPVVAERVRDVFINRLLAAGAIYVVPIGEVARGVARAEIQNSTAPSPEEVIKLAGIIKVQAIITGTVREYGEVRSGTISANFISLSLQMIETQIGRIVWTGSTTKGGISVWDRLFGGGGQPMNVVTEQAVDDLINKLFGPPQETEKESKEAVKEESKEKEEGKKTESKEPKKEPPKEIKKEQKTEPKK